MPSKKRILIPEGKYHLTARGVHKRDIFKDEQDYYMYIAILKNSLRYYEELNYEIICYCLMRNHVHLLIKIDRSSLAFIMNRTHSMYAKYFNSKYDYEGHLFQERYFSEIIKDDVHMLEVSRYIHLNPVRAKIVKSPQEYRYSSYNGYIGKAEDSFIKTEYILKYFILSGRYKNLQRTYKKFVESAINITPGVVP